MKKYERLIILFCLTFFVETNLLCKMPVDKMIGTMYDELIEAHKQIYAYEYRNRVTVMDFENKSEMAEKRNIGFIISELLMSRLVKENYFFVCERKQLDKILSELKLRGSGATDETTVSTLGKLVGADIIIVGSVSELGAFFNINTRVIEVKTSRILSAHSQTIEKRELVSIAKDYLPARYRIGLNIVRFQPDTGFKEPGMEVGVLSDFFLYYYRKLTDNISAQVSVYRNIRIEVSDGAWSGGQYWGGATSSINSILFSAFHQFSLHRNIDFFVNAGAGVSRVFNAYTISDLPSWTLIDKSEEIQWRPTGYLSSGVNLFENSNISFRIDAGLLYCLNRKQRYGYEYNLDVIKGVSGISVQIYF